MTDEIISASQVRAGRALLAWSQQKLSQEAKVAISTIADFERGAREPVPGSIQLMRNALELAGVQFFDGGAVIGAQQPTKRLNEKGSVVRWVDATDFVQWSSRRDAQELMAELLSKLIRAQTGASSILRFPAQESVQTEGWDGMSRVAAGAAYRPVAITTATAAKGSFLMGGSFTGEKKSG